MTRCGQEAWRKALEKVKGEKKTSRSRQKKCEEKKTNPAGDIKVSKYPLGKAPGNLSENQEVRLEMISRSQPELYRAYLLKEKLRLIFHMKVEKEGGLDEVKAELDSWRGRAWRSRIRQFVDLQKKIRRHYDAILATMKHRLSNAGIEAANNNIKLSIRMAYGFRKMNNMLAMLMLRCSAIEVNLPKMEPAWLPHMRAKAPFFVNSPKTRNSTNTKKRFLRRNHMNYIERRLVLMTADWAGELLSRNECNRQTHRPIVRAKVEHLKRIITRGEWVADGA